MKIVFLLMIFGATAAGTAQPVEWSTNWFATNMQWRASGGVLYNVKYSDKWQAVAGRVIELTNGIVLMEHSWEEPIYETIRLRRTGPRSYGNFIGGGGVETVERKIGTKTMTEALAITNCWKATELGWPIEIRGRRIGAYSCRGESLELYDAGTTPVQAEIEQTRKRLGFDGTNTITRLKR